MDTEVLGARVADPGRRGFLRLAAAVAAAAALPTLILPGESQAAGPSARRLSLFNLNTREAWSGVYWRDGAYVDEAVRALDVLLRDHRANETARIDRKLYDLLWRLNARLGADEPFKIVSGFRSRRTNAMARRRSRGVAKDSYHTKGMAVDIALENTSLRGIYSEAKALGAGGVGHYPRSGFVHVDTGPVRSW